MYSLVNAYIFTVTNFCFVFVCCLFVCLFVLERKDRSAVNVGESSNVKVNFELSHVSGWLEGGGREEGYKA